MLLLVFFCTKCSDAPNNNNNATSPDDSIALHHDSGTSEVPDSYKDTDLDEDDLKEILAEHIRSYKDPVTIDSTWFAGKDTFRLVLTYSCLMDSAVTVPAQYVKFYGLDSFVTHNFTSSLQVKKNGILLLDRTIKKQDFDKELDASLRNYGVLLSPYIKLFTDSVQINYSLSIPLTDVGIPVSAVVNKEGGIRFGYRRG